MDTTKARERLGDWLAPDPEMSEWDRVAQPVHRTEVHRGPSAVLAKPEGSERAMLWVEDGDATGSLPNDCGQYATDAPSGTAVLGVIVGSNQFRGLAVLGSVEHGGPERWAESSLEDHLATMVAWGVPLAPTQRAIYPDDNAELET